MINVLILTDENRLLGLPIPPMWSRLSLKFDCHVTPFVTVPAPLLRGRFLEVVDIDIEIEIGDVGLVSVFTEILPPQAPESVATGMMVMNQEKNFCFFI